MLFRSGSRLPAADPRPDPSCTFAIGFYIVIIMYIFFEILHIDTLKNFQSAMIFEIIGFVLLAYFILGNIALKPIKTGYFVPLMMVVILYTIILDVVNIAMVAHISHAKFVLINLIVLFIYCLISIPMYIMGRR